MDKTKSMDFGLGPASRADGEKSGGRGARQMSMDLNLTSPYLLPGAINDSRDSIARSAHSMDDRFGRPMTAGSNRNGPSSHHPRRMDRRDSSQYEQSMYPQSPSGRSSMDAGLLNGASRMPTSTPPPVQRQKESIPQENKKPPVPQLNIPNGPKSPPANGLPASPRAGVFPRVQSPDGANFPRSQSPAATPASPTQDKLNAPAASRPISEPNFDEPNFNFEEPAQFAARDSTRTMEQPVPSLQIRIENPDLALLHGTFDYENRHTPTVDTFPADTLAPGSKSDNKPNDLEFRFSVMSAESQDPRHEESQAATDKETADKPSDDSRKSLAPKPLETRRLSMGYRPLPPEGSPSDTAEERANRIRSFYKEYFSVEESAPPPMPTSIPAHYYEEYSHPEPYLDEKSGGYVIPGARPFAEGPVRRAMTPPPRMPPRFDARPPPGPRSGTSMSSRPFPPGTPGPRSGSSASNFQPNKPSKPLEPPKPLHVLPTPSKMTESAFASPTMFAPRPKIHESPSDPRGGLRPYSPAVPAHIPLVTSFDDLAVLPSPHMLRKSGYFTALDFAPPRKFRNDDGMGSDSGSVRSGVSAGGMSEVHRNNIRAGAYRVSKIPTAVVPLKDQMDLELKPTWDMRPGVN